MRCEMAKTAQKQKGGSGGWGKVIPSCPIHPPPVLSHPITVDTQQSHQRPNPKLPTNSIHPIIHHNLVSHMLFIPRTDMMTSYQPIPTQAYSSRRFIYYRAAGSCLATKYLLPLVWYRLPAAASFLWAAATEISTLSPLKIHNTSSYKVLHGIPCPSWVISRHLLLDYGQCGLPATFISGT